MIVQVLVFAAFVWFTMKFVWPPIEKAMQERQDKIADGLAAAERGQRELELAQHRAKDELKAAKAEVSQLVEKANKRALQIVEEAKNQARDEAKKVTSMAQQEIAQEVKNAKEGLRQQVAQLAVVGAEKIIGREVAEKDNKELLDKLIEEI